MTNERTDHVAEARKCIAWAQDQQEREGEFDGSVRDNALLAQAEATLAIVERQDRLIEQQRIANLIALAGLPTREGPVSDYADELRNDALATLAHYESRQPDYEAIKIDPDIASALGIQGAAS